MLKRLFIAAVLTAMASFNAQAELTATAINQTNTQDIAINVFEASGLTFDLNWKVGDSANYSLSGGVIQGTMTTLFREKTEEGFWVQQDMDLGFLGKQKVEILYNRSTGEVLKLIVNGKEETPPKGDDLEIIESKETSVTVPKGTFDCIYAKLRNKSDNSETEVWINPNLIPLGGLIKTVSQTQMGPLNVELTDFKKQ